MAVRFPRVLGIPMTPELHDAMRVAAARELMTMCAWTRLILVKAVKKSGVQIEEKPLPPWSSRRGRPKVIRNQQADAGVSAAA
jgi:hypothetical protein